MTAPWQVYLWLFFGLASYWYMLERHTVDLFDFFSPRNWQAGAAMIIFLGPLTLPTYYIIKRGRR